MIRTLLKMHVRMPENTMHGEAGSIKKKRAFRNALCDMLNAKLKQNATENGGGTPSVFAWVTILK